METSRSLQPGFVTERVLKTGLTYQTAENYWTLFDINVPRRNFDDRRYHDPLIVIAQLFSGHIHPPISDRIKILEALHDSRHQAQERLWSGDKLSTTFIHTRVKLWPEQHLAYTEKAITVYNHDQSTWRNGQEAIYSFQLPEGGVVTSLSLWIEGKEEKAILTTKEKADSAYRTIVGVESRDPSVVRWQEGNTVSVRVFPVNPTESRVFKIGITAPLKMENRKMVYENIAFRGPVFGNATEYTSIENEGSKLVARKVPGFSRNGTILEGKGPTARTGASKWKLCPSSPGASLSTDMHTPSCPTKPNAPPSPLPPSTSISTNPGPMAMYAA